MLTIWRIMRRCNTSQHNSMVSQVYVSPSAGQYQHCDGAAGQQRGTLCSRPAASYHCSIISLQLGH